MNKTSVSAEFAGKTLTFETGELAPQATAAVLGRLGDTVVLVTVVEGGESSLDYFPLSVEVQERLYAGGRIKGSRWVKREGRPSDDAILTGRLIDRSIRPLFPKAFKHDVQVIITILSIDEDNDADMVAFNTVSAALAISRIPWNGPVAGIRMGYTEEGGFISNPTRPEQLISDLDLVVSQTKDLTNMIETGAMQVSEEIVHEGIVKAHEETRKVIASIEELVKKVGQEKLPVPQQDAELTEAINLFEKTYKEDIQKIIQTRVGKEGGGNETGILVDKVYDEFKLKNPTEDIDKKTLAAALEKVMFKMIRSDVVNKQKRADGRKVDELREITGQVGLIPRVHGSGLFQRGLTQVLSIATLGSPRMEQLIETAEGEESRHYMHHYSGLPYSFGQTGRVGTPGRREIGHGALAEKALRAVLPAKEDFPYTIRVVSEVLSQNGSSSMGSTCGSTLALMDAGVPITAPVAGISIGMMSEGDKYTLLTDIIGLEDFSGDMDFKVAGTEKGITAIQLDVKIPGLTDQQVSEILARARTARMHILEVIVNAISEPRAAVSEYAPKIEQIHVPVEKIGEVIGPSGKNIKNIIATTGADVDIDDDGKVSITGVSAESVQKAVDWISGMTREVVPGEEFEGEVKRILPFGAFVEYLPGREGMVHVSKMKRGFVKDPAEVVAIGDVVRVKIEEKDQQGRINLTMLLGDDEGPSEDEGGEERQPNFDRPQGSGDDRGQRSFDRPSGRPFNNNRRNDRNDRGGDRPRSDHPLSRQLQRENDEKRSGGRGKFGPKKRFSR